MYLQGRPPPSVNMYWRRFATKDIPLDDSEKFEHWLKERWYEKDALMEQYLTTGRFPRNVAATNGASKNEVLKDDYIETEVKLSHWWEILNLFTVLGIVALIANLGAKAWNELFDGRQ